MNKIPLLLALAACAVGAVCWSDARNIDRIRSEVDNVYLYCDGDPSARNIAMLRDAARAIRSAGGLLVFRRSIRNEHAACVVEGPVMMLEMYKELIDKRKEQMVESPASDDQKIRNAVFEDFNTKDVSSSRELVDKMKSDLRYLKI